MFWVTTHVNCDFIDGHIYWILKVVFGQYLIDFFIIFEEALKLETALGFLIRLVLENFIEAGELDFIPELAECGSGYLYTEGSLSILVERYPSKLFSRSLAVI